MDMFPPIVFLSPMFGVVGALATEPPDGQELLLIFLCVLPSACQLLIGLGDMAVV